MTRRGGQRNFLLVGNDADERNREITMKKLATLLAAVTAIAVAVPAQADTIALVAPARDITWVKINACSPNVSVRAAGDGYTDLDFVLYDTDGTTPLYSDYSSVDYTSIALRTGLGYNDGCRNFWLKVVNRGSVYNRFAVGVYTA